MSKRWMRAGWIALALMGTMGGAHASPTIQVQKVPSPAPSAPVPSGPPSPSGDSAPAQTARATIQVVANVGENDHLGQTIVQHVMQNVNQSVRFQLVSQPQEAGLILHLVTISPDPKDQITAYGETYTIAPHGGRPEQYVYSTVTVCGEDRAKECAQGVMDEMGHVLDMVQRAWERHELLIRPKPQEAPPIEV